METKDLSVEDMAKTLSIGRAIAEFLANKLNKDWVWNENYPRGIAEEIAELVAHAITERHALCS